ncbi:MAG: GNAT family N-acetyltransferase [Opitutaceae bacterium]|nr:GNAT family N-acetyltransferase [Cytophagales bacterium]
MSINYTLKTRRLELKPLALSDADALWPYVSNSEISKLMAWDAHQNIETTISFLQGVQKNFDDGKTISWGIHFEGNIIGIFSLISILKSHRSLTFDKAELAYWIGPEFAGKGYMTEAGEAVLHFAFETLGLNKIYVGHHAGNDKSKGLIERLNFKFTHIEEQAFKKHGDWIDVFYYQMLKKEYNQLYKTNI